MTGGYLADPRRIRYNTEEIKEAELCEEKISNCGCRQKYRDRIIETAGIG